MLERECSASCSGDCSNLMLSEKVKSTCALAASQHEFWSILDAAQLLFDASPLCTKPFVRLPLSRPRTAVFCPPLTNRVEQTRRLTIRRAKVVMACGRLDRECVSSKADAVGRLDRLREMDANRFRWERRGLGDAISPVPLR